MGVGEERQPGNPCIHSFKHVGGHLLGIRPALEASGRHLQSGVETGLCGEP